MSLFVRIIATLLVFCAVTSCSEKRLTNACESRKIEAEIRHRLLGVKDYQIDALVSLEGVEVVSRITGKMPDRLTIRLEMPHASGLITETAVFDGTYQWVETKTPSSTQVLKVDLAELTGPERPFDSSYYMMGTGLLNGESYPETITTLLSVYDLEVSCSANIIELSGTIDIEKFRQYASKRRSFGSQPANIEKFAKVFGYLNMEFDAVEIVIRRYALGSAQNKENFVAEFRDIKTNQGIGNEAFAYSPPPGVVPVDITEDLKKQGDY